MYRCTGRIKALMASAALLLALIPFAIASTPAFSFAATAASPIQAPAANMPASSMYCWSPYSFAPEASNGAVLKALNVNRVYQSFGGKYPNLLKSQDTVNSIADLKNRGIETYLLCGEPNWGLDEEELKKGTARISAIKEYNDGIGASAQIKGIVFDIEPHTTNEWKADKPAAFRKYVDNMRTLYNHSKANGVRVIQCIPRTHENVSSGLLEELIRDCCDELSVMNYGVGSEDDGIETEVAYCKTHGKPIESVFNTMPPNGGSIPENITYYNRSFGDLLANWEKLCQKFGAGSVGMSYHHFENVVPVLSGGGMVANIYAYTSSDDPTRDSFGQTSELDSIILHGSDGSVISAALYHPELPTPASPSETAYLAIGVKPDVKYTVKSGDPKSYKVLSQNPAFEVDAKGVKLSAKIDIAPGEEVEEPSEGIGGSTPVKNPEAGNPKDPKGMAPNGMIAKAKVKVISVPYSSLKNKNCHIAKAKAFKISKANGKVTFRKASGSKKIAVSLAGKVILKKGLKKGTYKVKVKVSAAGDASHLGVTKVVTLKIKVINKRDSRK